MKKSKEINLLLIEDNPGDARLILEMLKESTLARPVCTVAENLEQALSLIKNREFGIIILDLNLPESSGIGTLDRIIGSPGVIPPVIVLTGLDDETIGLSAIERGAEDYLVKGSINAAQLSRSIRYAIERARLVQAFRESEERYRQLFDASPDGVVVIKPDGCIAHANIAQGQMFRYDTPDDLIGVHATHLVAQSMREYSGQIMQRRLTGENVPPVEYELVRKDGTTFYGETMATTLRKADGTISGYICVTRDTTERKQDQKTLLSQLDELRQWQAVMVDRETRGIELKKEINDLLRELGRPEKYGD